MHDSLFPKLDMDGLAPLGFDAIDFPQLSLFPLENKVLNPQETLDLLIKDIALKMRLVRGIVMGLSGTDSILSFYVCSKALESLGREKDLLGVHFLGKDDAKYKSKAWLESVLKSPIEVHRLSEYQGETENNIIGQVQECRIDHKANAAPSFSLRFEQSNPEVRRWAKLQDFAINCSPNNRFWIVGTMNKTERLLRRYSNTSKVAVLQIIPNLYKSDVLELCEYIGVPENLRRTSQMLDCECGRTGFEASNIKPIDITLGVITGELPYSALIENKVSREVISYVRNHIESNEFRVLTPYSTPKPVIVPQNLQFNDPIDATSESIRAIKSGNALEMQAVQVKLIQDLNAYISIDEYPNTSEIMLLAQSTPDEMIKCLTNNTSSFDLLSKTYVRVAKVGFSFPIWRFPSIGGKGSILFRFGFKTNDSRLTDFRLEPDKSGHLDNLGNGFHRFVGSQYQELRRTYIVLSDSKSGTLIIRNSNFFFGRDRLPYAAYYSPEHFSFDDLQNIDPAKSDSILDKMYPLPFSPGNIQGVTYDEWMNNINELLTSYDRLEIDFSEFLAKTVQSEPDLVESIKNDDRFINSHLAFKVPSDLPWKPSLVIPIKDVSSTNLRRSKILVGEGMMMFMANSPDGDFPLKREKISVSKINFEWCKQVSVVTGAIGSGKSEFVKMLKAQGAVVVHADEVCHKIFKTDMEVIHLLVATFGKSILNKNGTIDRARLRERTLNAKGADEQVERIIRPSILREIADTLRPWMEQENKVLIVEFPIFFEKKLDEYGFKSVIVLNAEPSIRLNRVLSRSVDLTEDDVRKYMRRQIDSETANNFADIVIDNNSSLEDLEKHAQDIYAQLASN